MSCRPPRTATNSDHGMTSMAARSYIGVWAEIGFDCNPQHLRAGLDDEDAPHRSGQGGWSECVGHDA